MTDEKEKKESVYERLSKIDVKPYIDVIKSKKGFSLSYLSWAKAWGLVKAIYPDASYKIKEYPNWVKTSEGFQQAGTLDYRITQAGCEVETTVTIEGVDYTQKLYPMDYKNNPIMNPNIKDINKAQLRCLVKALATAGLGLNVYAGEDLPSNDSETAKKPAKPVKKSQTRKEQLNQATQKIKDHAAKTPVNQWSKQQLESYQIKFSNGDLMTMERLMNGFSKKDPKAIEISNLLKGESMDVFQALLKKQ